MPLTQSSDIVGTLYQIDLTWLPAVLVGTVLNYLLFLNLTLTVVTELNSYFLSRHFINNFFSAATLGQH